MVGNLDLWLLGHVHTLEFKPYTELEDAHTMDG
jgi:hypothetical protein